MSAFTSSDAKGDEVMEMGAHHAVNSRDVTQLEAVAGSFDFILSTVAVDFDWYAYHALPASGERLHVVGAAPSPIPVPAMALIDHQCILSGTPAGSSFVVRTMLDFCARHRIESIVEYFPMSRVNEALALLAAGKARYRIVLENDLV